MRNQRGFTLVEILIAVALIGLALALMVSGINWSSRTAAMLQDKLVNDMREIETAVQRYRIDYPNGPVPTMAALSPLYLAAPRAPEEMSFAPAEYFISSDVNGLAVSVRLDGGVSGYADTLGPLFALAERFPKKIVLCILPGAVDPYCNPGTTTALTDPNDAGLAVEPNVGVTYWIMRKN